VANQPRRPRTLNDARTEAEAAFKKTTTKVPETPTKPAALPGVKELVSLRIDQDVLEHFQEGGPGWQDRINEALRRFATRPRRIRWGGRCSRLPKIADRTHTSRDVRNCDSERG
jgi:uncharacterized protein (DUF4415 family)